MFLFLLLIREKYKLSKLYREFLSTILHILSIINMATDIGKSIRKICRYYSKPDKRLQEYVTTTYKTIGDRIWNEITKDAADWIWETLSIGEDSRFDVNSHIVISPEQLASYEEKGSAASHKEGKIRFAPFESWLSFKENIKKPKEMVELLLNVVASQIGYIIYDRAHPYSDKLSRDIFAHSAGLLYTIESANRHIDKNLDPRSLEMELSSPIMHPRIQKAIGLSVILIKNFKEDSLRALYDIESLEGFGSYDEVNDVIKAVVSRIRAQKN